MQTRNKHEIKKTGQQVKQTVRGGIERQQINNHMVSVNENQMGDATKIYRNSGLDAMVQSCERSTEGLVNTGYLQKEIYESCNRLEMECKQ
jgi:hypothetical protein